MAIENYSVKFEVDNKEALKNTSDFGKGLDSLDKDLSGLNKEFGKFNIESDKADKLTKGLTDTFKKSTLAIASTATGLVGLTVGFKEFLQFSIKSGSELENQLRNVNSLISLSEQEYAALRDQVKELNKETGYLNSSVDITAGLYDIISASFTDTSDALKVLNASNKGAAAALNDVKSTADLLTTALNSNGLGAEHADQVMNQFLETVARGKTTLPELAANLGTVFSNATLVLGKSKDSIALVNATLAATTKNGIATAESATALSQAFLSLATKGPDVDAIFKKLGINIDIAKLNANNFIPLLEDINTKVHQFENADEIIIKLFPNVRSLKGMSTLLSNLKDVRENFEAMKTTTTTLDKQLAQNTNTLTSSINSLKFAARDLGDSFFQVFRDDLKNAVDYATGLLNNLGSTVIGLSGAIDALSLNRQRQRQTQGAIATEPIIKDLKSNATALNQVFEILDKAGIKSNNISQEKVKNLIAENTGIKSQIELSAGRAKADISRIEVLRKGFFEEFKNNEKLIQQKTKLFESSGAKVIGEEIESLKKKNEINKENIKAAREEQNHLKESYSTLTNILSVSKQIKDLPPVASSGKPTPSGKPTFNFTSSGSSGGNANTPAKIKETLKDIGVNSQAVSDTISTQFDTAFSKFQKNTKISFDFIDFRVKTSIDLLKLSSEELQKQIEFDKEAERIENLQKAHKSLANTLINDVAKGLGINSDLARIFSVDLGKVQDIFGRIAKEGTAGLNALIENGVDLTDVMKIAGFTINSIFSQAKYYGEFISQLFSDTENTAERINNINNSISGIIAAPEAKGFFDSIGTAFANLFNLETTDAYFKRLKEESQSQLGIEYEIADLNQNKLMKATEIYKLTDNRLKSEIKNEKTLALEKLKNDKKYYSDVKSFEKDLQSEKLSFLNDYKDEYIAAAMYRQEKELSIAKNVARSLNENLEKLKDTLGLISDKYDFLRKTAGGDAFDAFEKAKAELANNPVDFSELFFLPESEFKSRIASMKDDIEAMANAQQLVTDKNIPKEERAAANEAEKIKKMKQLAVATGLYFQQLAIEENDSIQKKRDSEKESNAALNEYIQLSKDDLDLREEKEKNIIESRIEAEEKILEGQNAQIDKMAERLKIRQGELSENWDKSAVDMKEAYIREFNLFGSEAEKKISNFNNQINIAKTIAESIKLPVPQAPTALGALGASGGKLASSPLNTGITALTKSQSEKFETIKQDSLKTIAGQINSQPEQSLVNKFVKDPSLINQTLSALFSDLPSLSSGAFIKSETFARIGESGSEALFNQAGLNAINKALENGGNSTTNTSSQNQVNIYIQNGDNINIKALAREIQEVLN